MELERTDPAQNRQSATPAALRMAEVSYRFEEARRLAMEDGMEEEMDGPFW